MPEHEITLPIMIEPIVIDFYYSCHGGKGIVVVDPLLLNEAVHHQPRLVFDHHAQLVLLELEHPL